MRPTPPAAERKQSRAAHPTGASRARGRARGTKRPTTAQPPCSARQWPALSPAHAVHRRVKPPRSRCATAGAANVSRCSRCCAIPRREAKLRRWTRICRRRARAWSRETRSGTPRRAAPASVARAAGRHEQGHVLLAGLSDDQQQTLAMAANSREDVDSSWAVQSPVVEI